MTESSPKKDQLHIEGVFTTPDSKVSSFQDILKTPRQPTKYRDGDEKLRVSISETGFVGLG